MANLAFKSLVCIFPGIGLPDFMECLPGFWLKRLRQAAQCAHGLLHPIWLLSGFRYTFSRTAQKHLPSALGQFPSVVLNCQAMHLCALIHADYFRGTVLGLLCRRAGQRQPEHISNGLYSATARALPDIPAPRLVAVKPELLSKIFIHRHSRWMSEK